MARWVTWDDADRDVAVAQWVERDVNVVFPRHWADRHGTADMVAHARERVRLLEAKTGKTLAPGSVLLAFSRHVVLLPREQTVNPDVPRALA